PPVHADADTDPYVYWHGDANQHDDPHRDTDVFAELDPDFHLDGDTRLHRHGSFHQHLHIHAHAKLFANADADDDVDPDSEFHRYRDRHQYLDEYAVDHGNTHPDVYPQQH